jgi:hypothetical protein
MSADEENTDHKEKNDSDSDVFPVDNDDIPTTEKPEVTDEHKEKAKEMAESYQEERDTITLPGADGTISGTAVNDWLDDDGKPKYGEDSKPGDESSADDKSDKAEVSAGSESKDQS